MERGREREGVKGDGEEDGEGEGRRGDGGCCMVAAVWWLLYGMLEVEGGGWRRGVKRKRVEKGERAKV